MGIFDLWLIDVNQDLVEAWKREFAKCNNVFIRLGNILHFAENTIVSPSNSLGMMDGGVDLDYSNYFGPKPQEAIRKAISMRSEGYLPVGAALLVNTGDQRIPYLISAPTMDPPPRGGEETGAEVPAANAYFAMSAVLQVAYKNRNIIKKVFCPGLGTGSGRIPFEHAAREMAGAYRKCSRKFSEGWP